MKKLLTTLFIAIFLFTAFSLTFAQEDGIEQEENEVQIEMVEEEQEESLADTLETKEVEEIEPVGYSFWTILGAILIPSTFIILAYFILKFFQT